MSDVTQTIDAIREAASEMGLAALARSAGVPYTTLVDWEKNGFRPKAIERFERLAVVARRHKAAKLDGGAPKRKTAA